MPVMNQHPPTKFRRTRRVLVWALMLGVGFLVLLNVLVPPVLEKIVNRSLRQQGFEQASSQVRFVSLSRADFAAVQLGGDAVKIDSIRVNYSLKSLLQKRVDDLLLGGVQIRYPQVMKLFPDSTTPETPTAGSSITSLPFRSFSFTDARVFVTLGEVTEELLLRGEAVAEANNTLGLTLRADSEYGDVSAVGTVALGSWSWRVNLKEPHLRWSALLARLDQHLPVGVQLASLEATVQVEQRAREQPVELNVVLRQPLSVYGITNAVHVMAEGTAGPQGITLDGHLGLENQCITLNDLNVTAGEFKLPFALRVQPGQATNLQARLVVEDLHLVDLRKKIRVGPVAAQIELPVQAGQTATGQVSIAAIHGGEHDLGGLRARTRISFKEAEAVLTTDLLTDTEVGLRFASGEQGPEASLVLPPFALESKPRLLALAKSIAGVDLVGTTGITGVMDPRADQPLIFSATLMNVGVHQKEFSIDGLNGTIQLIDLLHLRSLPHQQMSIGKLAAGKFEMTDGAITFTLENSEQIFIEENRWTWAGGRLFSAAFLFRPAAHRLRMEAYCEAVDLQQVLNLAIGDQVGGKGSLYGRIPLSVGWDPYRFSIGDGYMFAAPGKGYIQVKDKQMVDQVLASATQSLGSTKQGKQIQEGMLLSLKDFQYETLRLDFRKSETGFPSGTMHINGRGRDPTLGLPLDLTINFSREENE
ncbi:MAG: hypothetical protein ACI9TH_003270 [Kiritimatiellia bacterium]|jgi:hypothetical protein